jgi:DNA replication protein DnaC
MDDEITRVQAALRKARTQAGINPDTGRSQMPNGNSNASAPTLSQSLAEWTRKYQPMEVTCSECGGSAKVVQPHLRDSKYECATCVAAKNEKWERQNLERKRCARAAWLKDNVNVILAKEGVLKEHLGATLDQFPSDVVNRAISVLEKPDQYLGLFVSGAPGVGKSYLLSALARRAVLDDKSVRWRRSRPLLRQIWDTYRDGADKTEGQVIDDFSTCDLLLIDDLAHEGRVSEAVLSALHEIISRRNGNHLPTAISTNLTLLEIGRHYNEGIVSRLGAWLPVVLIGPDRRQ